MTTLAEALAPRSDQLNADDLIAGPRTLKITNARIAKDGRDIKVIINFEGDNGKPWKPCKTMGRAMVMAWAVTDEKQFIGKSVRVYRDPTVRFGDQGEVGGIRISHMSHIDKPVNVKLTVSQGKKGMFTFAPLPTEVERADKPRKTAEEWAADHIAFVTGAADLERLAAVQQSGKAAMDKLGSGPIFDRVSEAYAKRFAELSAGTDDDPFEPATGRADADHGDQFDGTEAAEGTK